MINAMSKNWFGWGLALIIIGAICLRFYQLGEVPHGMTWDEAAIGYNGYAIRVARRDEWLVKLPVSFRSFGDYKAPLAIYLNGLSTWIFDLNLFAVRVPFAVSGVVAVAAMSFLTRWLLTPALPKAFPRLPKWAVTGLALLAGLELAFSPWHVHYSRLGFESGMSLAFLILGIAALIKWITLVPTKAESPQHFQLFQIGYLAFSALSLSASLYTYHSAKMVVPGLVVMVLGLWWRWAWRRKLQTLLFLGGCALLSVPLVKDIIWGEGSERFNQASLLTKGYDPLTLLQLITSHFLVHLDPRFLVMGWTPTLRHGDGAWGVLYVTTLGAVLLGALILIKQVLKWIQEKQSLGSLRPALLAVSWIVIGLLPAAVGIDVPHSNRALLALPGFILLAVWGMAWLWQTLLNKRTARWEIGTHGEKNSLLKAVFGCLILIHSFLVISYLKHYYTVFAAESAQEFKDGYLEALAYVIPYEKGRDGKPEVQQVLFTSDYGQPYIYTLFARRTDPIFYRGGSLIKYLFVSEIVASDLERKNTMIVASESDDLPLEKAEKIIYGSDGQVKFKIYRTQ